MKKFLEAIRNALRRPEHYTPRESEIRTAMVVYEMSQFTIGELSHIATTHPNEIDREAAIRLLRQRRGAARSSAP